MSCRPSSFYNIIDPVDAFCFDRAILVFGNTLKAELDRVEEKTAAAAMNKRQRILAKWIPEASAGFRDPAKQGNL